MIRIAIDGPGGAGKSSVAKAVAKRLGRWGIKVEFAYQETDNLPFGYTLPSGRIRPWGTAHAVACLDQMIDSPFALINADDYYGPTAFKSILDLLSLKNNEWGMVSYRLKNTLSKSGSVSRGICDVKNGYLRKIHEEYGIVEKNGRILTGSGECLSENALVSMNLWGFTPRVVDECKNGFLAFLDNCICQNSLDREYYLTDVISHILECGDQPIRVIETGEAWQGITNKEDLEITRDYLDKMISEGIYPIDF